jgi:glycosyltransferase involved in cell wall biosynthesis
MKILLSSYACEPGKGSEPGIGWNVAREIANYHQVWVLTSNTHRPKIEAELAHNPLPNLNFVYLDPFGWVYDWSYEGKRSQLSVYLHYYLWQIMAYFVARPLHQKINFDVVHHITYGRYSSPSFLVFLSVPFVWGPVGGAESAPKAFWQKHSLRARIYENLRNLLRSFGESDPFVHLTAKKSVVAIAATEETAQRFAALGCKKIEVYGAVGIPKADIEQLMQISPTQCRPFRFISTGRLLHWKGFHFGLRAFAQTNLPGAEYWIIGDGPEREILQSLAQELGIADRVNFWGALSRKETLSKLGECDVLIHPSLHDSGGWVVLEAMAAGCPVICLNLGGPGIQVTEETGFKVPAHSPEQAVNDIAVAMMRLAKEPELRIQMGKAGRKRVWEVYNWEVKGKYLAQIYQTVAVNQ